MGVIEPDYGTRIVPSRSSSLGNFPGVQVGLAGRDGIVLFVGSGSAVVVRCSLRVLSVEDAMRMHAVWACSVILEKNADRIANFGSQDRAKNSRMLPLRK